jgi:hypothetical protein
LSVDYIAPSLLKKLFVTTMSSLEKRLEAFRQLPLRAQLALIASTRANPVLAKNQEYIAGLERIHAECLETSTSQQRVAYEKAKGNLTLN